MAMGFSYLCTTVGTAAWMLKKPRGLRNSRSGACSSAAATRRPARRDRPRGLRADSVCVLKEVQYLLALPCPSRDQCGEPFGERSAIDRNYCGGQLSQTQLVHLNYVPALREGERRRRRWRLTASAARGMSTGQRSLPERPGAVEQAIGYWPPSAAPCWLPP